MDYNDLIEPNEHGRPKLKGRRIRVQDIVISGYIWKWKVRRIAQQYQLSKREVRACLAYYKQHRPEIDAAIKADWEAIQQLPKLTDLLDNEE